MNPEYAARYGNLESWHWWFRGRQRILADLLERELVEEADRRILAVGAGPAEGLAWLAPYAGRGGAVIGLDLDPIHARIAGPGLLHIVGDMAAAPLRSRSVDVVLALDVLEHIDDDAAALSEVARLVRPGGLLVVAVPALPSLWGAQDEINHHWRRYTRATLADAFARARLPSPRLTYFNTILLPVVAAVRLARRAAGLGGRVRTDFDDNRPGVVNDLLAALFASERHAIRYVALPLGVSLLATIRVE